MAFFLAALFSVSPLFGDEKVSFNNEVMAVISKTGCNIGGCHGNLTGKGGLKISLRGEDSHFDFNMLTRELFGRRINPLSPDDSLILIKATGQIAHEGGQRFSKDSKEYALIRTWIAQGAIDDTESAPQVRKLTVSPLEKIVSAPEKRVQLTVTVEYSDGTRRDMKDLVVYEPVNSVTKVSAGGLVEAQQTGETVVLVRYLNQQVPVRLAFIPARSGFRWSKPKANNFIDDLVFKKLESLRINPSEVCTDNEFVRRSYLDIIGIPPTAAEARQFVADSTKDKRARLVDALLERPEFSEFWAAKWADLLRIEEKALDRKGVENFYQWIRRQLAANRPLDAFARDLISARGSTYANPAANFYRVNRDPVSRAESTAQVFLGTRLQCAQCHNHPYERWTMDDYYNWTTLFARVDYKVVENRRRDTNDKHEFVGEQIVFIKDTGGVSHPRTGRDAKARFLGAKDIDPDNAPDRLEALAAWLTAPENKQFARAQANRIWFHLFGRGIVDPVDDFRSTNLPSHPELLDRLAAELIKSGYDLRQLIRTIAISRTYQASSTPNETNREDESNFSRAMVRRLTAEQMLDAESQFTGVPLEFNGYPSGTRATQIPGVDSIRRRNRAGSADQFLAVFGKPPRLIPSECERSSDTTMGQAFQLISGPTVQDLLSRSANRLGELLKGNQSNAEIIDELYWAALARPASATELAALEKHISGSTNRRAALEDISWALLNAKEFVFRK